MIRRAGPFDPPLLAAIHAAAFPPCEAWSAALFAGHLSMPGVFAYLADAGGMILARVAGAEAEILTLAVAPPARRAGLGRQLLAIASAEAASAGAETLFLEVSERNASARRLYETAGFTVVGRRRGYYPDQSDALVLRRASGGQGALPPAPPLGP